jgi:hypothetical protein
MRAPGSHSTTLLHLWRPDGAEFLHATRASVRLSSVPCEGQLLIPYE